MWSKPVDDSAQQLQVGRPRLTQVGSQRSLQQALCTVALWGCTSAVAVPASLGGTTFCLSPTNSVFVSGVPGAIPDKLADRLYVEMKSLFRVQGVRFVEVSVCKTSPAVLTFFLDVTPIRGSSDLETKISGRVADESQGTGGGLFNSALRWSGVQYGKVGASAAEINLRLLEGTRAMLAQLVANWKAANS